MTGILTALVILVGIIGLGNVMFLYGVTRRLRLLDERVTSLNSPSGPQPGHRVGAFSATTLDGRDVGTADLEGTDTLVALLTVGCGACDKVVGELADVGGDTPLLVLVQAGESEDSGELVGSVRGNTSAGARIAVVPYGPVASAFDVNSFPTIMRVSDGVVRASGYSFADVGEPARVG
jgi:hypothetical protein